MSTMKDKSYMIIFWSLGVREGKFLGSKVEDNVR
jgi:hypothetical protein